MREGGREGGREDEQSDYFHFMETLMPPAARKWQRCVEY